MSAKFVHPGFKRKTGPRGRLLEDHGKIFAGKRLVWFAPAAQFLDALCAFQEMVAFLFCDIE